MRIYSYYIYIYIYVYISTHKHIWRGAAGTWYATGGGGLKTPPHFECGPRAGPSPAEPSWVEPGQVERAEPGQAQQVRAGPSTAKPDPRRAEPSRTNIRLFFKCVGLQPCGPQSFTFVANGREAPTPGHLSTIVAGLPPQPMYFFYNELPANTYKNATSSAKRKAGEIEDDLVKEDGDDDDDVKEEDEKDDNDEAPPPILTG
jgi:hypothetical protein